MQFKLINQYYQTILLIIEDRPKYEIPLIFYKVIIFISYLQIFIYLFTVNESKVIDDLKVEAIAKIIQMVSLKNILSIKENDTSSFIIYLVIQVFMYSYFVYVGVLAFFKHYLDSYYEQYKKFFIQINQILNMYFALYIQIFFTQLVELNSSIMFCSKRSLLLEQRISETLTINECSVPIQQTILGIFGLFLTLLTAWIAIHFFRNYEFMEYNLIKRRISYLFSILILLKFFLTVLYFAEVKNEEYIKHILSQVIGFLSLFDYFINRPYSDMRVAHIYLKIVSWYYALVNMFHIWLFTDSFMSNELFYFSLLFGLMVENLLQALNNYQCDHILLAQVRKGYIPQQLDFYLEEVIRLATDSSKDELSKIKLYKIMKSHQQLCENQICLCKEFDASFNLKTKEKYNIEKSAQNNANINRSTTISIVKNKKKSKEDNNESEKKEGELQFDYVLSIVDSIFKFFLQQNILTKNQVEYEHFSLKYITFMIKYLKNYTRANYELKLLQFQREDFSSYFKVISKIISSKIQVVISQMNIHLEQRRKDELTVSQITSVEEITQKFIPIIIKVVSEKQKLWGSLQKGYRNMNSFQNEALKLMKLIQQTKNQFFKEMNDLKRQQKVSQLLQFQKLYLLFYLFVLNDNIMGQELENLVQDLRKRDSLKEIVSLSNENYLRENIITIRMSISQSLGKIVSKKDEKTANFFGFNKQDFLKITKINELMPNYISRIHDNIVKQFVNSGDSQYIKSSKHVFAKDQTGFIIPVKLYLDYSFLTDNDFQVSGTLLKVNQAFDYIIFHRTGKVVGITNKISQLLLNNSSQKGNNIPSGEFISNNLQAHLLIPNIAKRILKRKDIIMSNLRSDGDVLLQDRKGYIILRSNPLIQIRKLQSYIIKMNQSQTLQSKVGGVNSFDHLDLFNDQSYELVSNYKRQEVENSLAAGLSSGRFSGKVSNRSINTKGSVSKDYQKYKIKFNYTLSFSCISQGYNTDQDLYFQLKMNDMNIIKVKEKQKNSFKLNLVIYLLSTSLINRVDPKFKNVLKGIPMNDASKISQLNEWSFSDEDIPNKLLKLAVQNENLFKAMNDDKQKQDETNEDELDDDEKKQKENQSDSSEDEDENNDLEEDEEEQVNIEKLRNKKKLLDQYEENAKFVELNEILLQNQINEKDILKLDPNYKVKKVIQFKSLSKAFGRAFEQTTVEALLEISKDKNLLQSNQFEDQNIQEIATFRDYKSGPDFRQLQEFQSFKDNIYHNSSSLINTEQNIIKQNSKNSNTPKIIEKQISIKKTQQNDLEKSDISLININTAQDTSILPSFRTTYVNHEINVDISHDNMITYKNQETNYFGTSARPFFQKQEKHEELNIPDNQTLITPSVDDKSKPTEFSNVTTFQNAVAKKEKEKNQQQILQNSSIQLLQNSNMNLSINQKYKEGSSTQIDKTQSLVNQKDNNEFLKSSQSNRQLQLTNFEVKQLQGQTVKSDQSGDKDNEVDDQSGKIHEKVVVHILNQKGLKADGSINKGSVHSSSRSSTSYGGNFLKEIIKMCKIPKHSYQYSFLLIFFIIVFMCLNITNLMIIQSDMQYFTDNVVVLRQPRKYLRCYAKSLFGKILNYEIKTGLLEDPNGSIKQIANLYIENGLSEYFSLVQQFQRVITEYSQQQQNNFDDADRVRIVDVYQFQEKSQQIVDFALTFQNHLFFLIGAQVNQTEKIQIDSYLYLRANFFQFSTDIQQFGSYLVSNVLNSVDNLILKFTVIAICAIFGVIIVSLISLPIIRLINLYEEKILMIVSRINYDQSQIEKLKLNVCQQLIDIDQYDWLKYNYTDITCLRFEQFDINVVNSQHDLQKVSSRKGNEGINVSNMIKAQQEIYNSNTQRQMNQTKNTPKENENTQFKRLKQFKKKNYDDGNSSYQDYQINMKNSINKNFVLQSKIINQKLSVFQRFIPLFILTICNTIYFLVIIVYLQESKDLLKVPVQFNKRTILYHIAQSTLKVSVELLTFNSVIEKAEFEKVQSDDLDSYQSKMYDMINLSVENSSQNTELVYGDNPFPSDVLNKFKDFEEGRICQYLVKNKCDQAEVGNIYSYNFMLTEKLRTIKSYPDVITSVDAPLDKLTEYTNSKDHLEVFINSFLTGDEVLDLYSSSANLSIGTISDQVQSFLMSYLQIFGNLFGLTIILVCIYIWRSLYQRIQLMNLLLTFIPEEKLLEEVTLQMLKSLRRM